jgi:hypothetical protein
MIFCALAEIAMRAYSYFSSFGPDMTPAEERLYEAALAVMSGGARMKKTFRSRLAQLDSHLARIVRERFDNVPLLRIHDVGASTAITSVELFQRFAEMRPTAVHASDRYDFMTAVDVWPAVTVYFDADNRPIQFAVAKWGMAVTERNARRKLPRLLAEKARRYLSSGRRISLFHPKARALAASDPRFTLGHYDLFQPSDARYEIVRAMNVLNPKPLTPERIREGIASLSNQVVDGGLMILGRRANVTIFEKTAGRMSPTFVLGTGYPVASLVR